MSKVGIYNKKLSDEDSRPDACETHVRGLYGLRACVALGPVWSGTACVAQNGLYGPKRPVWPWDLCGLKRPVWPKTACVAQNGLYGLRTCVVRNGLCGPKRPVWP
jgi:hypothetical protein